MLVDKLHLNVILGFKISTVVDLGTIQFKTNTTCSEWRSLVDDIKSRLFNVSSLSGIEDAITAEDATRELIMHWERKSRSHQDTAYRFCIGTSESGYLEVALVALQVPFHL